MNDFKELRAAIDGFAPGHTIARAVSYDEFAMIAGRDVPALLIEHDRLWAALLAITAMSAAAVDADLADLAASMRRQGEEP